MGDATLTLSISKELKKEMVELKGINWSEEARQFLQERVRRLKTLKLLDELTRNSKLTEEDAIDFGRKINAAMAKKHGFKG